MKFLKYIFVGFIFGLIMSQAEIISWYRIYEMFHFKSFHMYGIIGSAIGVGILLNLFIKKKSPNDIHGNPIIFTHKKKSIPRYLIGGIIFGLGWALAGACPGPMFVLLGQGNYSLLIVLFGAISGTWLYGVSKNKLPH
jgi:uncharacterized membrane protein YedE/YeeE